MDKIQICNVLLTQRCNLNCSYCHLVQDYERMPEIYPRMDYYKKQELTSGEWIEIFERLYLNNPNMFSVIYGGEPFLFDGLADILNYLNNRTKDLNYTVITNNTDGIQKRISEVREKIGKFKGFTSSVDPLIFSDDIDKGSDIYKKSMAGFQRLIDIKQNGYADDVVAEITVTPVTLKYLYKTVESLSEYGIYSSITAVDLKKTPYYDFSGVEKMNDLLYSTNVVKEVFNKIKSHANSKLLVHIPELLDTLFDNLPCQYKCDIPYNVHNMTISPDGHPRLCLRIRGKRVPMEKVTTYIDIDGDMTSGFRKALSEDYNEYCLGCNWTCQIMSSMFSKEIKGH